MLATHAPTIGGLVTEHPALAELFDWLGIDYCCSGRRSLEDACHEAGLHYPTVLARIYSVQEKTPRDETDFQSLSNLCEQIVETHHAFLRGQFPLIDRFLEKVVVAHVGMHPELTRLQRVFEAFATELRRHMAKEEQMLFPAIIRLEQTGRFPAGPFGSIANPITAMEIEHVHAGDALGTMRALTAGFIPPADACPTYRALLKALEDLERDMHRHVHKENNVLFPEAIRLEAELIRKAGRSE